MQRTTPQNPRDERKHGRFQVTADLRVSTVEARVSSDGQPYFSLIDARVMDASHGGLALRASQELQLDERVVVETQDADGEPLVQTGRVAWVQPQPTGDVAVGVDLDASEDGGHRLLWALLTGDCHEGSPAQLQLPLFAN